MADKLRVALLEDSQLLLKDHFQKIKEHDLAEVRIKSTNAADFLNEFEEKKNYIDALVMDIDLIGESLNGIDIAKQLDFPVLFITGKTRDFIGQIEELRIFNEEPIEFLTKPVSDDKLIRIFEKFEQQIKYTQKSTYLELPFKDTYESKIAQKDIILIRSKAGARNNEKEVVTTKKDEPFEVSKMSMKEFFASGLRKDQFEEIGQSYIINKDYLDKKKIKPGEKIYTIHYEQKNRSKELEIELPRNYLNQLKKSL